MKNGFITVTEMMIIFAIMAILSSLAYSALQTNLERRKQLLENPVKESVSKPGMSSTNRFLITEVEKHDGYTVLLVRDQSDNTWPRVSDKMVLVGSNWAVRIPIGK